MITKFAELSHEELKRIWAGIEDDPYEGFSDDRAMEDFIYDCGHCAEVIESLYLWLRFENKTSKYYASDVNEEASDLLQAMDGFYKSRAIERWCEQHPDYRDEFNDWWWRRHDPEDYVDE